MIPAAIKEYAEDIIKRGAISYMCNPKEELDHLRDRAISAIEDYKIRKKRIEDHDKEVLEIKQWLNSINGQESKV